MERKGFKEYSEAVTLMEKEELQVMKFCFEGLYKLYQCVAIILLQKSEPKKRGV